MFYAVPGEDRKKDPRAIKSKRYGAKIFFFSTLISNLKINSKNIADATFNDVLYHQLIKIINISLKYFVLLFYN